MNPQDPPTYDPFSGRHEVVILRHDCTGEYYNGRGTGLKQYCDANAFLYVAISRPIRFTALQRPLASI
jgi:hypothetical protein